MKAECPNGHPTPPEHLEAGKVVRCANHDDGHVCDAVYTVTPSKEKEPSKENSAGKKSAGRPRKVS